jgi:hypothetical protein
VRTVTLVFIPLFGLVTHIYICEINASFYIKKYRISLILNNIIEPSIILVMIYQNGIPSVVLRYSGEEGARTIDYLSGRIPWKVLEDPGRIACHRAYRGLRTINTAYLSAVE